MAQNGGNMVMAARMNLVRDLSSHKHDIFSHKSSIRQWKGVIEGVAYLHNRTPPIIHGDLKPVRNWTVFVVVSPLN
jgi:hypothetical protein